MTPTDPDQLPIDDSLDIETIDFSTPERKREVVKTPLALCGETYEVMRPKDAALFFLSSAYADSGTDADKAMALIQWVESTHAPKDHARFLQRCCDRSDPLRLASAYQMVDELMKRWDPANKVPSSAPVVIGESADVLDSLEPVRIRNDDLGLDLVCHPPKDIALAIVASSLATNASEQQKSYGLRFFLDASLDKHVTTWLMKRWFDPLDELDLPELEEISTALMQRWYPEGAARENRKQRRAKAAQDRKKTPAKKDSAPKDPVVSTPMLTENQDG